MVTDVAPTTIPFDIKSSTVGEGQTLVTLSSVEDDGLGEELRVLWELEAGRRILDSATLPDISQIPDTLALAKWCGHNRGRAATVRLFTP